VEKFKHNIDRVFFPKLALIEYNNSDAHRELEVQEYLDLKID
jgi:hypothetical protein